MMHVQLGDDISSESESGDILTPVSVAVLRLEYSSDQAVISLPLPAQRPTISAETFPSLLSVLPQPAIGVALFIAHPAWSNGSDLVCIDTTAIDGRLFVAQAPPYANKHSLLLIAHLPRGVDFEVFFSVDQIPVEEQPVHLFPGALITFLHADCPPPTRFTLGELLQSPDPWGAEVRLPTPAVIEACCLVHKGPARLCVDATRYPMAYRDAIAATTGADPTRMRLFAATPQPDDVALQGVPFTATLAVGHPPPGVRHSVWHCALLDCRPLEASWKAVPIYNGFVAQRTLFASLCDYERTGWTLRLDGLPEGPGVRWLAPGQIVTATLVECEVYSAGSSEASAPGPSPGDSVQADTGATPADHGGDASGPHPSPAPTEGHVSVPDASLSVDSPIDVRRVVPAHFLICVPAYAPEQIIVQLPVPCSLTEALQLVTQARDARRRAWFPRLFPVSHQFCPTRGILLALPPWEVPGVPVLIENGLAQGRFFACMSPPRAQRQHLLALAQLSPSENVHVYVRDMPWPLDHGATVHVEPGDLISLQSPQHAVVVLTTLTDMLCDAACWQPPVPLRFPRANALWLLNDGASRLFHFDPTRQHRVRRDFAAALRTGKTHDLDVLGFWARAALVVTSLPIRIETNGQGLFPYILDARPVFLGVDWAANAEGVLNLRTIEQRFLSRCPPGSRISCVGGWPEAPPMQHFVHFRPGEVFTLSFEPAPLRTWGGSGSASVAVAFDGDQSSAPQVFAGQGPDDGPGTSPAPVNTTASGYTGDGRGRHVPASGRHLCARSPLSAQASLRQLLLLWLSITVAPNEAIGAEQPGFDTHTAFMSCLRVDRDTKWIAVFLLDARPSEPLPDTSALSTLHSSYALLSSVAASDGPTTSWGPVVLACLCFFWLGLLVVTRLRSALRCVCFGSTTAAVTCCNCSSRRPGLVGPCFWPCWRVMLVAVCCISACEASPVDRTLNPPPLPPGGQHLGSDRDTNFGSNHGVPQCLALLAHRRPVPTPVRGRSPRRLPSPRIKASQDAPDSEPQGPSRCVEVEPCTSASGSADLPLPAVPVTEPAIRPRLSLSILLPLASWDPDPVLPLPWTEAPLHALSLLGDGCPSIGGVACHFTASQLWDLLCPRVSFVTLSDLCQLLPTQDTTFLATLDPHPNVIPTHQVWCFTDGSYTPPRDGHPARLGWACVFSTGDPPCFSIVAGSVPPFFIAPADVPSAFVAECCALTAAMWLGTTAFRGYHPVYKADCKAALFVAEDGHGLTDRAAAQALRSIRIFTEALAQHPPAFEHVAGHSGNFGNELADAAARLAARGIDVGFLPWHPGGPDAFDWWSVDTRHVEWAGVVCQAALGNVSLPGPSPRITVFCPTPPELSPAEQVAPFLPVSVPQPVSDDGAPAAQLALRLLSYNVLSLNGAAYADGANLGLAFAAGRPALLASTLREHEIGIAFVQEARTPEGLVNTDDYLRFCSGTERGHLGVEIWLRRNLPVVSRGREHLVLLCRDACSVLLSDPRRLVVHFQQGSLRLHFICLHAPHRGHSEEELTAWWNDTIRLCSKFAKIAPLVLGGDLNACIGSHTDDAISDACAEQQDLAGSFVHGLAASGQLWFPATWDEVQSGTGWTFFQKRNSAATRPDFVALPQVWRDACVAAWVEPNIHAGQACLDHLATVVSVAATLSNIGGPPRPRKSRIDTVALRAPANKARLRGVLQRLPVIPWQTSADTHAAMLVRSLQDALADEFPLPKAGPKRGYLSAETWQLHQHVAFLRHRCARLKAAVRKHTLAAFFAIWLGTDRHFPSAFLWARQADYVGTVCSEQLRAAATVLRQRCKADRTAHLAALADAVQANQVDGAAALQQLLKQKHKKPYTPDVLPRLRKADGRMCQTGSEITARWRQHFEDMEAGRQCAPEDLAGPSSIGAWPLPSCILDIPAPGELMRALAASKAGKAPGPDMIPGEALSGIPSALALHLLPLLLKFCVRGTEAVGLQSSTLCTLYKQRGRVQLIQGYHALAHHCKGIASFFEATPVKSSYAVIFADVASAYYNSLRELTARHPCGDGRPPNLDFVPEHDGLQQQLAKPSVLQQGGASAWLEAIVAEMHRRTWFTVTGDGQPVQTRRGSRPGSTFADLMFGAGVTAILDLKNELRAGTPGAAAKPSIPWDGRRDLSYPSAANTAVSLEDVVWADDVAECVVFEDAGSASVRVATSTSNFAEAFASFGYTLTFGATKTAAMMKLTGPGSRRARSELFGRHACLPVLLENAPPATLPVVTSYKHLGMIQTPGNSLLPEIKYRCGNAWQAFRQGRKAVYRNKKLSMARRGTLLGSAVLTRLFFGAGAWPFLRPGEEQTLIGTMMGILRQTLCVPHGGDQHVCRAETCALLGVADPVTALRVERLRYVRQLVAAAPDALWALVRLDAALLEAYRDAFGWLYGLLKATVPLPDPLSDWEPWCRVMTERPGRFRGWIKRAKRLAVLRLTCGAALFALARCVREVGSARDPAAANEASFTEA
ncbi:unnamed protein product [Symbiodinium sp. CCMP2592]|nr:unnamed protein product [Symbiodinium sp. CCMP2592]